MATPDISANQFYTMMTDPTKGLMDKHDDLVKILAVMLIGSKQATEYKEFRDFLRGKQGAVDKGIAEAKAREFAMEQGLSASTPDEAAIMKLSDKQAAELSRLARGNNQIEGILATMFSAEGAAASDHTPSTATSGLYFEVQAQTRSIDALVESNGNTQGELQKLANGGTFAPVNDNGPAPVAELPALAPVVNRVFVPEEFGKTQQAIIAPAKAEFKKRPPTV